MDTGILKERTNMTEKKEQAGVLQEFLALAAIPRPSHHEEKISAYLLEWAKARGFAAVRDERLHVIIDKPASPGFEHAPQVILQAHTDMVCVAEEGVSYDPLTDPIRVISDGKTLTADGTSLGADDGMGVAMCLYLLQKADLRHGPLRVILTADEENGMDSVYLDPEYLAGDYLINLDWEEEGSLCNSCAGGSSFVFRARPDWEMPPQESTLLTLRIRNLLGGHSGIEIHKGHANALTALASAMLQLAQKEISFRIAAFDGGQAENAIPKAAEVSFAVEKADAGAAEQILQRFIASFGDAFRKIEPAFSFTLAEGCAQPGQRFLSSGLSARLAALMCTLPGNVHTMSPFVDGLVESSANLGTMCLTEDRLEFSLFARSSSAYYAEEIAGICRALANCCGFDAALIRQTPGWEVNPESELVHIACEQYRQLTGRKMKVEPVHAGVECGAFAKKNPKLDMISIGPTLHDVHTPQESCDLESVQVVTELVARILEELAKR